MKIRSITVVKTGDDGQTSTHEVYREPAKKRKSTKGLGMVEKIVRRAANTAETFTSTYVERHNKSNQKKKDGWIKDAPVNVMRSGLKGLKRVKIVSFL